MAIDISPEADRLLAAEGIDALVEKARNLHRTHLADDALSTEAAMVSKADTRRGHRGVGIGDGSSSGCGHDPLAHGGSGGWGHDQMRMWSLMERRLIAGAVVVAELREQVPHRILLVCVCMCFFFFSFSIRSSTRRRPLGPPYPR